MPHDMQSRHGNWIHLHQHPCIVMPDNYARRNLAARFLFLAANHECPQAVRAISIGEKCAPLS